MEFDTIKNTLNDMGKKSQDLISQKFEEQNLKISKIMQEYKKLFMKNWELNSQINNLIEQQESQKTHKKRKPTKLGQYIDHHGWLKQLVFQITKKKTAYS